MTLSVGNRVIHKNATTVFRPVITRHFFRWSPDFPHPQNLSLKIAGTIISFLYNFLTFISRQKKLIFHLRHRENHHQFRLILRHIHR